jgi:glycogen debranching enzyme
LKESTIKKLWNEQGYFQAQPDDDRFDTTANVFASLYLLNPQNPEDRAKMINIQDSIKSRVETPYGLKNFDPPYPDSMIAFRYKIGGIVGYHNKASWPWIWGYNILAKERLLVHLNSEENTEQREQLRLEIASDLHKMANLFEVSSGPCENYFVDGPKTGKPLEGRFAGLTVYKSEPNFAGSAAAYLMAAYTAERLNIFPKIDRAKKS